MSHYKTHMKHRRVYLIKFERNSYTSGEVNLSCSRSLYTRTLPKMALPFSFLVFVLFTFQQKLYYPTDKIAYRNKQYISKVCARI